MAGRFPENRILSHDLLEGCYARAGLLSDVQLYEDYPARYSADVSRRHRWIRGDWQLAGWLLRRVPGQGAHRQRNPLSVLSQWKLIDNLRRSLVPAALMLLLLLGWTLLSPAWLWTLSVIGIMLAPSLCASILELFRKPDEVLLRQHLAATARSASRHFMQVAFELACLPYEAFFSLDAIARTAWRMLVTRRRLLEWNPSSEVDRESAKRSRSELAASFRSMWVAPAIASAAAIYLVAANPAALAVAAPILLLWFASPAIAWWISRPLARRKATLTVEQTLFLRALSRRTWAFFENFVGPEDHWLPPDNFQEYRVAAVAHRTSPTNIGLALLANLSAYDFGYIPAGQLVERTANTLRTMDGLERYRGHFYNWYDTQTLQPLPPLYVSTVDSGNLAGHLLTLRPGLLALADDRILGARLFDGLSDTLRILVDAADGAAAGQAAEFRNELESACAAPPSTLAAARLTLVRLAASRRRARHPDRGQRRRQRRHCARERSERVGTGACLSVPRSAGRADAPRPVAIAVGAHRAGLEEFADSAGNPDPARTGEAGRGAVSAHRASARRGGDARAARLARRTAAAHHGRERPRQRQDGGHRTPGSCNPANSRAWSMTSCSTRRVIC